MAELGDNQSKNTWPLVKFQFLVKIEGLGDTFFQEVSGLTAETQVIEYRAGNNTLYSTVKMPGIKKYTNVVFKKGNFQGDNQLWDYYSSIQMNTIKRVKVEIALLDEDGKPAVQWVLNEAFPVKMTISDMKADANESAIETLEMAYESMTQTAA
jgi:phage tail-like protein